MSKVKMKKGRDAIRALEAASRHIGKGAGLLFYADTKPNLYKQAMDLVVRIGDEVRRIDEKLYFGGPTPKRLSRPRNLRTSRRRTSRRKTSRRRGSYRIGRVIAGRVRWHPPRRKTSRRKTSRRAR